MFANREKEKKIQLPKDRRKLRISIGGNSKNLGSFE